MKAEVITWVAGLPDDADELRAVDAIRRGQAGCGVSEPLLSLKAVAARVGKSPSWLWRVGTCKACSIQIAGGRSYRESEVLAYLGSEECREEVKDLAKKNVNKKREGNER